MECTRRTLYNLALRSTVRKHKTHRTDDYFIWGRVLNFRCTEQVWESAWSCLTRDGEAELWTSSVCRWSHSHPAIVLPVGLSTSGLTIWCHTPSCALYSGKMKPAKPWPLPPSPAHQPPLLPCISPPALFATITEPCSVCGSLSKYKQRALAQVLYAFESLSPSSRVSFFVSSSLHTLSFHLLTKKICDIWSHVRSLVHNSH